MTTNQEYYRRITFIAEALDELDIPNNLRLCYNGAQLRFPWCEGDVACHEGTYGSDSGFVESYQFPWDDGDVTMLSPQEFIEKVYRFYQEKTSQEVILVSEREGGSFICIARDIPHAVSYLVANGWVDNDTLIFDHYEAEEGRCVQTTPREAFGKEWIGILKSKPLADLQEMFIGTFYFSYEKVY